MKALSKLKAERGLWMIDAPVPEIGPHDVLIRIKKTSICGTDIHIWNWDEWAQGAVPVPMITGHEYMGVVEKLGAEVTHLKVGQRVSGEGHLVCGYCRNCRAGRRNLCRNTRGVGVNEQGCFAEYFALPASNVFPLPDNIPDDIAAILDPFGNAVHTALAYDLVGEDVLITGAGPIGVMAAAVARHVGARHIAITDVNPWRLDLAKKTVKNIRTVDASKEKLTDVMKDLGMTEGFDVGMEMSGNPRAFRDMVDVMNNGGRIALLGIPEKDTAIDWNRVIFKELTIHGVYGREMYETWYKMAALLQSGLDLSPVITHRFKIGDFEKAFATMAAGECGKIVLEWE